MRKSDPQPGTENKKGRVLALGNFDGVHIGHAALLGEAAKIAAETGLEPAALVFDSAPENVLAGRCVTPCLTTNEQKAHFILKTGVARVIFIPFDAQTAALAPAAFVKKANAEFAAKHLVCGFDYRFGGGAAGSAADLKRLCEENGMGCTVISPVELDGDAVSSTRIRALVSAGDMEAAMRLLGRPFMTDGKVESGKQLGRKLGFPTINQTLGELCVRPRFGVYATRACFGGESYPAVTNIGVRPTVDSSGRCDVETYIIEIERDLYGQDITVEYYKMLRPETRFESVGKLRDAIAGNVRETLEFFENK